MPIDTYFIDSTPIIAPFMAVNREQSFAKNCMFMGRSGIKMINGLRVAFVSGLDSDLLGGEVRGANDSVYLGNYFLQSDVEKLLKDYDNIVEETGREGVDVLLTC